MLTFLARPLHRGRYCAALLLLCASTAQATEAPLTLLVPDFPLTERAISAEFFPTLAALLQQQLPEQTLHVTPEPVTRLLHRLEQGSPACALGLLQHPARDQHGQFAAVAPLLPMQAFIHRSEYNRLLGEATPPITASALLNNPTLHTVTPEFRVYTPSLQQAFSAASARITYLNGQATTQRSIAMLEHRRIDFLIEYPAALHLQAQSSSTTQLIGIALEEAQSMVAMGLYCPKTPWGNHAFSSLRRAIGKLTHEPQPLLKLIEATHGAYLRPEDHAALKQAIKSYNTAAAD